MKYLSKILVSVKSPTWTGILLSLSYLFAFMQRTGPGVVTDQLQLQFGVSSAVLGLMTSIQYLLYMILQIPVGLLGDAMGPARMLVAGVFLDGVGTLVFSFSHTFTTLLVGRGMVGLGDALIWVNIVLIIGRRFAASRFGAVLGIVSTAGNFGALLTTLPFAAWTAHVGWRGPFHILGAILIVVALTDGGTFQATKRELSVSPGIHIQKISVRQQLGIVLRDRNAWATFSCHFGAVGTYIGFVGLWAIPYFMHTYQMSREAASSLTLTAFVGAMIGGPIAGGVSDRLGNRRIPYLITQGLSTLAWAAVPLFGGSPPLLVAYLLMFVLGFGSGASLLSFAVIRDHTPRSRSGVTSGFANTGGFLSAVLLPVLYGAVIDAFIRANGQTSIPPRAYLFAFLVPTLFSFVGVLGALWIREQKTSGGVHSQIMETEV